MTWILIALFLGYLIGSIPFAIIVSKVLNKDDPRSAGSGNPGATNMLRTNGKLAGILTLLGDLLKGVVAVLLVQGLLLAIFPTLPQHPLYSTDLAKALTAYGAVLGHIFPVWLKFKGGKGVATALGVLLVISPPAGLLTLSALLLVVAISGYVSLAALTAFTAAPILLLLFHKAPAAIIMMLVLVLMFYKHKTNIQRLRAGTEGRVFGGSKKRND